ncbi:hypothetical protein IJT10_05570 [bacterium]|nr:hypothetical protein [bacterium]
MFKKFFSTLVLTSVVAFVAVPALASSVAPSSDVRIDNSYVAYAARYRVTIQRGMEMRQIIVVSDSESHAKWAVQDANWGWTVVKVEWLGSI